MLCRLKAVSTAWRSLARNELCRRASCRGAGQLAPVSLDDIVDLDLEVLKAADRAHEAAVGGRRLPSLARLRGWGFVVDVQGLRQAELSGGNEEEEEEEEEWRGLQELRRVGQALQACVEGEGEPPPELLVAAIACINMDKNRSSICITPMHKDTINQFFVRIS